MFLPDQLKFSAQPRGSRPSGSKITLETRRRALDEIRNCDREAVLSGLNKIPASERCVPDLPASAARPRNYNALDSRTEASPITCSRQTGCAGPLSFRNGRLRAAIMSLPGEIDVKKRI